MESPLDIFFLRFFFFLFLMWTILKVFICYYIASVLCFGFLATRHMGSQLPDQGLNPPTALEGEVLTTGSPGKSHTPGFQESLLCEMIDTEMIWAR